MTTLSDVARRAGVSLATASRALNGAPGRQVRPELRDRVVRAARELAYQPHAAAQTMARGQANSLGLLVNDITDPFFAAVAAGVTAAAARQGCIVTLATTGVAAAAKAAVVNLLAGQRVRALVLAGGGPGHDPGLPELRAGLARLAESGVRVCAIGNQALRIDSIALPNRAGAAALADALLDLGHRRFAILAGPAEHPGMGCRADTFADRVRARGGEITARLATGMDRIAGRRATSRLLDRLPDVIFAANDLLALGALRALRDAGIVVPDRVGLASFGDSDALLDAFPRITSVFMDARWAGELAADLVLTPGAEPVELGFEIRLRDSTRRAGR